MKRGNHDGVAVENIKVNHPSSGTKNKKEDPALRKMCFRCFRVRGGGGHQRVSDLFPHSDGKLTGLRRQQLSPLRGQHHRQVHLGSLHPHQPHHVVPSSNNCVLLKNISGNETCFLNMRNNFNFLLLTEACDVTQEN